FPSRTWTYSNGCDIPSLISCVPFVLESNNCEWLSVCLILSDCRIQGPNRKRCKEKKRNLDSHKLMQCSRALLNASYSRFRQRSPLDRKSTRLNSSHT